MHRNISANNDFGPLQLEVLHMAWEGCWYAPCEIIWFLEDYKIPTAQLQRSPSTMAKRILRQLLEDRLVSLRMFEFETGRQTRVSQSDAFVALSRRSTWETPMLRNAHLRLYPTKKGINAFHRATGTSAGDWRAPTVHSPFKAKKPRTPTLTQSIRLVRQVCDCELSIYSFVRTYTRAFDALEPNHEPQDRLAFFWWEAGKYGWRVLRWGAGDEERFFRGYLSLWLDALQISEKKWRTLVSKQGRPLEAVATWPTW